jgi:hypothetical protein
MKAIAICICGPVTLFISIFIALTLLNSMPPILCWLITVLIASVLGISSYSFILRKMQSLIFPYWDRLAQQLDRTIEFRLGYVGHIFFIGMICFSGYLIVPTLKIASTKSAFYFLVVFMFLMSVAFIRFLLRLAWWSPLYKGPSLVATPAGIKSNSCFIPWSDVVSTSTCTVGAGKFSITAVKVNTLNGCSEYNHSIERSLYEPHEIIFTVFGALPDSIAHYLGVRAGLQNQSRAPQQYPVQTKIHETAELKQV